MTVIWTGYRRHRFVLFSRSRRHTRWPRDWSSDVCSSDLPPQPRSSTRLGAEPWLRLNRERVQDLKLHRSAPKRVLDLGCGGGFFLFILKNLGHSVLGIDVERVVLFT